MLTLDHIVVSAETLQAGTEFIQDTCGVKMSEGGKHAAFGTHNTLLRLGDTYLEVIAIDPDAAPVAHARWFGLDTFFGPPRVTNWVLKTEKPRRVVGKMLLGTGELRTVARGDLTWQITVPKSGILPLDGLAPAIIDWMGSDHPTTRLPDVGCQLDRLTVAHPHAISLKSFLTGLFQDSRIKVTGAEFPTIKAVLNTPRGLVEL